MDINKTHRRKEMRLEDYDYSRPGVYFVTFCVKDHQPLFGTISNGKVHLNDTGNIVGNTWKELPRHYPHIALDDFVIMPNHMHGLLIINGDPRVQPKSSGKILPLGQYIASFKSLATKRVSAQGKRPDQTLWQRNYWDHIVRNEKELNRIREYILTNPSRWEVDRLNPDAEITMSESVTNRKDIEWMV